MPTEPSDPTGLTRAWSKGDPNGSSPIHREVVAFVERLISSATPRAEDVVRAVCHHWEPASEWDRLLLDTWVRIRIGQRHHHHPPRPDDLREFEENVRLRPRHGHPVLLVASGFDGCRCC